MPKEQTVLRLMARKSFALGLWIQDRAGGPVDINGAVIRIVARKSVPTTISDDIDNLITNSTANVTAPAAGFARFELQASDLDWNPGEYQFSITMTHEGYSTLLVQGVIDLIQNTEFTSLGDTFELNEAVASALLVRLADQNVIYVTTGPTILPGTATFTEQDYQMLRELYAGALTQGQTLNADLIPDGSEKVMMTLAERALLSGGLVVDWDDGITGKPSFGTASLKDEEYFLRPIANGGGVAASEINSGTLDADRVPNVVDLNGIVVTTSAPSGGNPGRITLKYTE